MIIWISSVWIVSCLYNPHLPHTLVWSLELMGLLSKRRIESFSIAVHCQARDMRTTATSSFCKRTDGYWIRNPSKKSKLWREDGWNERTWWEVKLRNNSLHCNHHLVARLERAVVVFWMFIMHVWMYILMLHELTLSEHYIFVQAEVSSNPEVRWEMELEMCGMINIILHTFRFYIYFISRECFSFCMWMHLSLSLTPSEPYSRPSSF